MVWDMIIRAFWEGRCVFVLGGAPKSAGWGLGSTGSTKGRRELGPGSVGAADIGLTIWKDSWDVQA